uniref:Uncharacterized protein n=1 Tax=Cyprinus carpio carpio TaxID=630221 RepID=A0A8C1E7W8_CYPCA
MSLLYCLLYCFLCIKSRQLVDEKCIKIKIQFILNEIHLKENLSSKQNLNLKLNVSQNTVTMQTTNEPMYSTTSEEYEALNITSATTSLPATGAAEISCFINAQLAFIATATAGGIILILLTSTIVLACTVSSLKRRHRAPRPSRSNADLVSGSGYWGTERREGGIVGPCETSVLLEEVKTDVTKLHCKNNDHTSAISHSNSVAETTYEWLIYI